MEGSDKEWRPQQSLRRLLSQALDDALHSSQTLWWRRAYEPSGVSTKPGSDLDHGSELQPAHSSTYRKKRREQGEQVKRYLLTFMVQGWHQTFQVYWVVPVHVEVLVVLKYIVCNVQEVCVRCVSGVSCSPDLCQTARFSCNLKWSYSPDFLDNS